MPPLSTPKEPRKYSSAALRALFRLQTGTTPLDPFPNEQPTACCCGGLRTSRRLLLEPARSRNDLLPSGTPAAPPDQPQRPPFLVDIISDMTRTPALITFLRRTGLGFVKGVHDRLATDDAEVDDLDVGPIGSLSLDLNF